MRKTLFQDLNGKQIQVSISSSGDYRVYFDSDKDSSLCLLLNKFQAKILINALMDLMDPEED